MRVQGRRLLPEYGAESHDFSLIVTEVVTNDIEYRFSHRPDH